MEYEIKIEYLKKQPTLAMTATTTQAEVSTVLADLLPQIHVYTAQSGADMAGPPFTRYHNWSPGGVELEAGMPVTEPAAGEGPIEAGELPGGPAAVTMHVGPYDRLSEAYEALEAWLEENGKESAGAPWEVYLTDPGLDPDPQTWQTKILWPVR